MTAIDRHLHSTGELRALSFAELHQLFADGIVKHGPFAGLKYPELNSIGSALYPKLLGCYEAEIQDWIEAICNTDYSEIVDVGCAEGFYGFVMSDRRLPIWVNLEFEFGFRVATNRCVEGSCRRVWVTLNQSVINLVHRAIPESLLEA